MKTLQYILIAKQQQIAAHRPFSPELIKNLEKWFKIELTYASNAIEGNTLTRQETALVVEKGLTIGGKSLKEHLEAINHAQALDFIKSLISMKRRDIEESMILDIHRIILSKIDDVHAGRYRTVPVRIAGSRVVMPNPQKVSILMSEFISWLKAEHKESIVQIAADAHFKFVSIHPFIDGNGRTARLLMNLLLMQEGYPPALIRKEDRLKYINAIEKGQLSGEMDEYYHIIYKSIDRSLNIYLKALEEPSLTIPVNENPEQTKLLKIGDMAKISKESVSTIRYWTNQGLLKPAEYAPSGYQLYEPAMLDRVRKIRQLQKEKRLTIEEIRKVFYQIPRDLNQPF